MPDSDGSSASMAPTDDAGDPVRYSDIVSHCGILEARGKSADISISQSRILEHSNVIKMEIDKMEANAEQATRLLTAMANPKRLLILCNLLEREMNVTELGEKVGLGQSPLSQHLSKLRAWDFVKTRRDGQQVHYSIASDAVKQVLTTLYRIYCID